MMPDRLPQGSAEIRAALEAARKAGPPASAQLAGLCLWRVSQDDSPHTSYTGPDGVLPLLYLVDQLEFQKCDDRPSFVTGSFLGDLIHNFPKPAVPCPPTSTIADSEADGQVRAAIATAQKAAFPIRRNHLLCESLVEFARRGFNPQQLQPLRQAMIAQWSPDTDSFGDGPKALLRVGEHLAALQLLAAIPIDSETGVHVWPACAKILVRVGQPAEARRLLDRVWAQRQRIPSDRITLLAEGYAYLGEAETARQLVTSASVETHLAIECLVALEKHWHGDRPSLGQILRYLQQTPNLEPPKHRAHLQTAVLRLLLHFEQRDRAWEVLPLIRESLLAIPLWSKLEYRTYELAGTLLPYCDQYSAVIYPLAADLLISKSEKRELWPMVHMVSGLGKLIIRWAGQESVSSLLEFLKSWQNAG